jgi:hypothetical protein
MGSLRRNRKASSDPGVEPLAAWGHLQQVWVRLVVRVKHRVFDWEVFEYNRALKVMSYDVFKVLTVRRSTRLLLQSATQNSGYLGQITDPMKRRRLIGGQFQ